MLRLSGAAGRSLEFGSSKWLAWMRRPTATWCPPNVALLRNCRSITLDLKTPVAIEIMLALIEPLPHTQFIYKSFDVCDNTVI